MTVNEMMQKAIDRVISGSPGRKVGFQLQKDGKISKKYGVKDRDLEWNYRELASNEIVMDIDYDSVDKEVVLNVVDRMCKSFTLERINYELYQTGGKGYHFHFFFEDMLTYSAIDRSILRKYFILLYGHGLACDYAKKDENTMIGIEWARHRKGTDKILIQEHSGGKNKKLPHLVSERFMLRLEQKKFIWNYDNQYTDFMKITPDGPVMKKPCIEELRRRTKDYNINRHSTALLLTSALRGEGLSRKEVIDEVSRYMDTVGYDDMTAEYLYDHSYPNVACSTIQDLLIGTSATQKCKSCAKNKDYVRVIKDSKTDDEWSEQ
jgi:hypothetical protein